MPVKLIKNRLVFILLPFLMAFSADDTMQQLVDQTRQKLTLLHDSESGGQKLRKCEVILSEEGFLRHRKTHLNGKQEYYSMNVLRLQRVDYLGSTGSGELSFRTLEDDVIVQTYNDRSGNVDSMSMHFDLHLRGAEPEDIILVESNLMAMKKLMSTVQGD